MAKSKKPLVVVLVIVVIAALGALGWWWYDKSQREAKAREFAARFDSAKAIGEQAAESVQSALDAAEKAKEWLGE